jgi:dephospho-CoA kinase
MLRVGLTGGIASGKSTVAAMMRDRGCHLLEADPLAHRLLEPAQAAHAEVVEVFGREVLLPDGHVDRKRLGEIVFGDARKLQELNRIIHPRVVEILEGRLDTLARQHPKGVAVVEAALLIESLYAERLDQLVVAWCRPEQQVERLLARGMTREQADRRIAAQMPLEQKRRLADYEVDCTGSLDETRRQVESIVAALQQAAAA